MSDEDLFREECRFAKVVETANGPAIMIGGIILEVYGPKLPIWSVDAIVKALRSSQPLTGEAGDSAAYASTATN